MKKYIFLCIVCITGMLGPPLVAQNVIYDTVIVYEVDSNRVLQREFCVKRSDFPLPIDASITPVDSILPNALTNAEIIKLAKHPGKVLKKEKITIKKGLHGNGIGIQLYEFFYEPYTKLAFQYVCINNDVQEITIEQNNAIQYRIRWDHLLYVVLGLTATILIIVFRKKLKDLLGKIRDH